MLGCFCRPGASADATLFETVALVLFVRPKNSARQAKKLGRYTRARCNFGCGVIVRGHPPPGAVKGVGSAAPRRGVGAKCFCPSVSGRG